MWNAVILPILTSLSATGLGIFLVWIFNTKRREDKISNEIAGITNKIEAVEAKIDNTFDRISLKFDQETFEKDTLLNAFNSAKTEMEQSNEDAFLKQRELYQNIIERLHAETLARREFSGGIGISIAKLEQEVANNSEAIAKLEQEVANNSDLINRIITIIENDMNPFSRT